MQHHQSIADIDRLLDELEQMAASNVATSAFLQKLLGRLRFLIQADAAALMLPDQNGNWFAIAFNGNGEPEQVSSFKYPDNFPAGQAIVTSTESQSTMGVSVRKHSWEKGALWTRFSRRIPEATTGEIEEIVRAFAEIVAIRQLSEQESFLDQNWGRLQRVVHQISGSHCVERAAFELVNGLPGIIGVDRATIMVRRGLRKTRVMAISGVAKLDHRADLVKTINRIGEKTVKSAKPVVSKSSSQVEVAEEPAKHDPASGLFANHLCLPLASISGTGNGRSRSRPTAALLLEWEQNETFLRNAPLLDHAVPMLEACWAQHTRWLKVPGLFRRFASSSGNGLGRSAARTLFRLAIVVGVLLTAFWFLTRPMPLRVESKGTLQTELQRSVYVRIDGYVEELKVTDGQLVKEGELLIRMRSPEISQTIQELLDEAIAVQEKRNGFNIEINQLAQDSPRYLADQNRLSSEIRLIDIQLANLQKKQKFWESQQEKLEIRAPIAGTVVARQLNEFLDGRPVKTGEQLFRIADFDGPWRLELLVADRDFGLVARNFSPKNPAAETARKHVDFVFASRPDDWLQSEVSWISDAARNPDGTGGVVDVYCKIDPSAPGRGHMGATVYAYFDCGQQPCWFVWSRGLVESIQRRIWF